MRTLSKSFILLLILSFFISCKSDQKQGTPTTSETKTPKVALPAFQADSAYAFIEAQVAFGPRVPNSDEHVACKDYLVKTLKRFGADVKVQSFSARRYDNEKLQGYNIIGKFQPNATKRILLLAHWDTRFHADADVGENATKPVMGADDGGSGVGVLLELARLMQKQPPDVGVDIIFLDLEDQGTSGDENVETWCLGAQHWAKNPHAPTSSFKYGILLDMVGTKDAQFYKEETSRYYAPQLVEDVWRLAQQMGYNHLFIDQNASGMVDDHLFFNRAGVRTIDIINFKPGRGFGDHWHTVKDDMDVIHKPTLKAVGKVIVKVVYD